VARTRIDFGLQSDWRASARCREFIETQQGVGVAAPGFSTIDLFWWLSGCLCTLAVLVLALPWIAQPRIAGRLGGRPARTAVASAILLGLMLILYPWLGRQPGRAAGGLAPIVPRSATVTNIAGLSELLSAAGAKPGAAAGAPAATAGSMESAVAALEARLAKGGGSAENWELLAKSYEFLGRASDAAQARSHALSTGQPANAAPPTLAAASLRQLAAAGAARHDRKFKQALAIYAELAARGQMNADAWADYADTAATLQNRKLAGEPETYIARALALDPAHPKALWLRASAAEEAARYGDAVADWRRLAALLPPDSADAKLVAANLDADARLQ
jgi:cytochrome c-type biogenesis protein CcmH/NrfG